MSANLLIGRLSSRLGMALAELLKGHTAYKSVYEEVGDPTLSTHALNVGQMLLRRVLKS